MSSLSMNTTPSSLRMPFLWMSMRFMWTRATMAKNADEACGRRQLNPAGLVGLPQGCAMPENDGEKRRILQNYPKRDHPRRKTGIKDHIWVRLSG